MHVARLLPALAVLAAVPAALAQEPPVSVDLVAAVVVGFADGATVNMTSEPMLVSRTGPGAFAGTAPSGTTATLLAVETTPCIFDISFALGAEILSVRIDVGRIDSIVFEPGGSMGLGDTVKPYTVRLNGPEGLAQRVDPDGSTETLSNSPPIATSLPPVELEAAATALKQACPTR
jgi:hypothetical protein